MIDIWVKTDDGEALARFCALFQNVMGPCAGEDGIYFACIRTDKDMCPPDFLQAIDKDEGAAILGVWA